MVGACVLDDDSTITHATFAIIFFLNASNRIAPTHSFLRQCSMGPRLRAFKQGQRSGTTVAVLQIFDSTHPARAAQSAQPAYGPLLPAAAPVATRSFPTYGQNLFCCARGYAEILSAFEVGQNGPWCAGNRCLWSLHATLLCLYVLYCVSCGSRAAFVSAIAYRDTHCLCCLSSEPQCEGSRNM